ncbi:MAG: hypothetical protein U0Q03_22465 [Acidimicrobiales bacterium]
MGKKDDTPSNAVELVTGDLVGDADADGGKKGKDGKDGKKGKKGKEQREGLASAPPADPGPLAPWRLSIAVAVSALLTGQTLFDSAMSGVGIDGALLRSLGVAVAVFVGLGVVNRHLAQAQRAVDADREAREAEQRARDAAELEQLGPKPWIETDGTESPAA